LKWDTLRDLRRATNGSFTTIFFKVATGVVVYKSGPGNAPQYFASLLSNAMGVYSPKMRHISTEGDEFAEIFCNLEKCDKGTNLHALGMPKNQMSESQKHYKMMAAYIAKTMAQEPTALIMEYVRDVKNAPAGTDAAARPLLGLHTLRDVGRLLAFDVLFYNTDRFSFWSRVLGTKWTNSVRERHSPDEMLLAEANLDNLIIDCNLRCAGIDQSVRQPPHDDAMQRVADELRANKERSFIFSTTYELLRAAYAYDDEASCEESALRAMHTEFVAAVRRAAAAEFRAALPAWNAECTKCLAHDILAESADDILDVDLVLKDIDTLLAALQE